MRHYIIRRLLQLIPTLLVVSVLTFILAHILPGDIIDAMSGTAHDVAVDRPTLEHKLGLDRPLYIQYFRWLGVIPGVDGKWDGVFQGNFGWSYWQGEPVLKLVARALPVSVELGLLGLLVAQLIALPIGVISALRQDKWADYIGRSFAIICISFPAFWVATLVIVFPAAWWGYMPPLTLTRFAKDPLGNLRMFIVPAVVLGMAMSGTTMRLTRTMMLDVLRQDYIRTAWAKGLTERVVIMRHALKNALIPVVSGIGLGVPVLIGGTVIIENIFLLPGMGRLIFNAILRRDELLINGIVLIFAFILVLINLIVDLSYASLDPRIRYK
jgi:peptide/nickel transport system permease protein